MEEYGTAIHILPVMLVHGPGTRLWVEDALVALSSQFWLEKLVVLLCFHFLQREGAREGGTGGARPGRRNIVWRGDWRA